MTGQFEIDPGTPIAVLVGKADEAFKRADVRGVDTAYRQAVPLADGELRSTLAADHVTRLLVLGNATLALRRCSEYLATTADQFELRLLRAEAQGAIGDHEGAAADATKARDIKRPEPLSVKDNARLLRVEGLVAADRGDLTLAGERLADARRHFVAARAPELAAVTEDDLLHIGARQGDKEAVTKILSKSEPKTTAGHLLVALAHRCECRYEEASRLLERALAAPDLDVSLRVVVLRELVILAWLMWQPQAAQRLTTMLRDAVAKSGDPKAEALVGLSPGERHGPVTSSRFDQAVQVARRLIATGRFDDLDDAERLLADLHPRTSTDRDKATWHLAFGELKLARHQISWEPSTLETAINNFGLAVDLTEDRYLVEIRIPALRQLGRAYARRAGGSADGSRAAWCWGKAARLEEEVASLQVTDNVRIGMLQAASDEHDERIRAATEAETEATRRAEAARGAEAAAARVVVAMQAAGVVVAMEAARGATILGGILPDKENLVRDLPQFGDLDGAWRWLHEITWHLPRSQVIWLLHATPDHMHHAIIGRRGLLHHLHVPLSYPQLEAAVDDLESCWDPGYLEKAAKSGKFDKALAAITELIAVRAVVPLIPPEVRRVATVAGGVLAEIPFAALVVPGTSARFGQRYAFSDLPCLSARTPLHQRSLRQRGDRALLVRWLGAGPTASAAMRGQKVLDTEPEATPGGLRVTLDSRRYHRVRIDSHGRYDELDPASSWLQLAPDGPSGRLYPDTDPDPKARQDREALQSMDLKGCGTLMLGACESGMAHRRGRDERAGFVRAGIFAGAGAVVAARWVAEKKVAVAVLNQFERYLRYLPRDVALQRAQLDVCEGKAGVPGGDHPARWACWTLYGDSGWQARPLGRLLRRTTRPTAQPAEAT